MPFGRIVGLLGLVPSRSSMHGFTKSSRIAHRKIVLDPRALLDKDVSHLKLPVKAAIAVGKSHEVMLMMMSRHHHEWFSQKTDERISNQK